MRSRKHSVQPASSGRLNHYFFVESALYFIKENMMKKALIFNYAHVAISLTWPLNVEGHQVAPGLHSRTRLLRTKVTAFAINVLKTKLEKDTWAVRKRQIYHQVHPVWKLAEPYQLLDVLCLARKSKSIAQSEGKRSKHQKSSQVAGHVCIFIHISVKRQKSPASWRFQKNCPGTERVESSDKLN